MKALIFDSGTLINLSMNGLLYILEGLKKDFNGKFLVTEQIKQETIDRPIGIQRFELGAIQIQNLLDSGILELPDVLGIMPKDLEEETNKLLETANHYMQMRSHWIQIVSAGEMSCLALSDVLSKRGVETLIAIDERTTRMLAENPGALEKVMSEKLHQPVQLLESNFKAFASYKFIRSSELVYVAYKKGLVNLQGKKVLEALLYATKFHGAAISFEEIEELKKL